MDKKPKRPRDVSQLAKMMVDIASDTTKEIPSTNSLSASYGKLRDVARSKSVASIEKQKVARENDT